MKIVHDNHSFLWKISGENKRFVQLAVGASIFFGLGLLTAKIYSLAKEIISQNSLSNQNPTDKKYKNDSITYQLGQKLMEVIRKVK